jgi:hypothetical protein
MSKLIVAFRNFANAPKKFLRQLQKPSQNRYRWWAVVNAVMNLRVPQNSEYFLTGRRPVSFSRRRRFHEVIIQVLVVVVMIDFEIAKFTKVT